MTLSALGIFSAAGAGGGVALSDYELIETQILGSSQASITFSSLGTYSSTYKHLQLRIAARIGRATNGGVELRFNSDSGSNYPIHGLVAGGSSVTSYGFASQTSAYIYRFPGTNSSANQFGAAVVDLLDVYATKNKTIRALGGFLSSEGTQLGLSSSAWLNTSSVTSILLQGEGASSLPAGSRFSLYGIKG
jgi:hypothetical protein